MKIDIKLVQRLRETTNAGMMKCKQALEKSKGNFDKAIEILRSEETNFAEKKENRNVQEGLIESYIHIGNKLGILIEINCETDFVSKKVEFKTLAKNIAMQIASNSEIQAISVQDISNELKKELFQIESLKKDLLTKPIDLKEKIIEGRVKKALKKYILLEQDYIKDPSKTVKEYLNEQISFFGENIKITRFTRYILGN